MSILDDFGNKMGLRISMENLVWFFHPKMCAATRKEIAGCYDSKISTAFGRYLGVDIWPHKLKLSNYLALLDKTLDKIKGWKSKLLNMVGRCTLVKVVLNSYPLYSMQTSLLPISIVNNLERVIGGSFGIGLIELICSSYFLEYDYSSYEYKWFRDS